MKAIVVGIAISAFFTACSNNNNQNPEAAKQSSEAKPVSQANTREAPQGASVDKVLNPYLDLKNALVSDNGNEAAAAGKNLFEAIEQLDETALNAEQKKVFADVKDEVKEHAEHISTNAKSLAHQREHFDILSKDMYDLVKVIKPAQSIYQTHCPMYNDNKGATWLSETKEVKNPYMGKKMLTCGSVKEEIRE